MPYLRGSMKTRPTTYWGKYQRRTVFNDLRRMKRQIGANKSELKRITYQGSTGNVLTGAVASIELTNIIQGDDDDERIGRRIHVQSVNIRAYMPNTAVDTYLIKSMDDSLPVYADFDPVVGGHITQTARYEKRELKYIRNYASTGFHLSYHHSFKNGLPVFYRGTAGTDGLRNNIFLVFKNDTGATHLMTFSVIVTYRDN